MSSRDSGAQWFMDRIGKRVYRGPLPCKCEVCSAVDKEGLVIIDKGHATYLYLWQEEGIEYYDEPIVR